MKQHSTNYYNTLIEIAEDCPESSGQIPPQKADKKSVANYQFELIAQNPYQFTSDEVLFKVFASRKNIPENELESERMKFFSKGQPCFRASPLPKRFGWGVHSNEEGKIALHGVGFDVYISMQTDDSIKKIKAMKSKR